MNNKSLFGLDEKWVAALSYLFGAISGIIVLVLERDNKFVKFHALQSTMWFLFLWILGFVLGLVLGIPILGFILGLAVRPVLWVGRIIYFFTKICLMITACTGKETKIPIIGDAAWNYVYK